MIERYTIKFASAASHKELMKQLHEGQEIDPEQLKKLAQVKVVIEAICDPEDLKKITEQFKLLSTPL
jgi:replication initiation and membrane attachment protein DnaB